MQTIRSHEWVNTTLCRDALYKMQSHFSEQVNHNQKRLSQVYDWLYEGECGI